MSKILKHLYMPVRTFKNFGHKREPEPFVTVLWTGFLTLTFVGLCIEWQKIGGWIFGKSEAENIQTSNISPTGDKS